MPAISITAFSATLFKQAATLFTAPGTLLFARGCLLRFLRSRSIGFVVQEFNRLFPRLN